MQAEEYLEEEHGEEYEEPPAEEQFEEARRVCMYVCVCGRILMTHLLFSH